MQKQEAFFSVLSVYSDMTTSHSIRLPKNASQVAGYVAKKIKK